VALSKDMRGNPYVMVHTYLTFTCPICKTAGCGKSRI
jgi:hypothetical protein